MNDIIVSIFISIVIIIILITKSHIHIRYSLILHLSILLFVVFLFYTNYSKSALMMSVLYLITHIQSYKTVEYLSNDNIPKHILADTATKKAGTVLLNDNLPTQQLSWYSGDSLNVNQWNDLSGNNNHILNIQAPSIKTGTFKWVAGNINSKINIQEKAWRTSPDASVTFIHITRYNPRSPNRGKLWTSLGNLWISGFNNNKLTFVNTNGNELPIIGGDKNGDIMNIRGSNWNLVIDQMDMTNKIRTVNVNNNDYVFQGLLDSIPATIGINTGTDNDSSDWECAVCMIYPRILDTSEIAKIKAFLNKTYMITIPEKISATLYNIYDRNTFSSITQNGWTNQTNTAQTGNEFLGTFESEYDCVSACNKKTATCNAFTYQKELGACHAVGVNDILNHNIGQNGYISGTNKGQEAAAVIRKKEADERKAREEREALERAAAAAVAAAAAKVVAEAAAAAAVVAAAKAAADKKALESRFIPLFDSNSNTANGPDGTYSVDVVRMSMYPCYDLRPGHYINGGQYGSVLDGNMTTGIDMEINGNWGDSNYGLPYIVFITLPVEKIFNGTFILGLFTPWAGGTLPRDVELATFDSTVDSNFFYKNFNRENILESSILDGVGGWDYGPYKYIRKVKFNKPCKYIALLIKSGWNQTGSQYGKYGAIWLASMEFFNYYTTEALQNETMQVVSNVGQGYGNYGSQGATKKSFMCPPGKYISGYFGRSGGWMDQIRFMCSDGTTYSEQYGGNGGGPNIGYSWSYPTNGFQLTSAWANGPLSRIGLLINPDAGVMLEQGGQMSVNPGRINCPADTQVIGVDVSSKDYVERITLKCGKPQNNYRCNIM